MVEAFLAFQNGNNAVELLPGIIVSLRRMKEYTQKHGRTQSMTKWNQVLKRRREEDGNNKHTQGSVQKKKIN